MVGFSSARGCEVTERGVRRVLSRAQVKVPAGSDSASHGDMLATWRGCRRSTISGFAGIESSVAKPTRRFGTDSRKWCAW